MGKSSNWIDRHETPIVIIFLLAYTILMFAIHGTFRVDLDNVSYVDPAVNYLAGKGFTSSCWYAQGAGEFWAGNVPLYQFLLILWFKATGVSWKSSLVLNFLYVIVATLVLWRALRRSNFISGATWRIGALVCLLLSDCAYYLLIHGRPEPLAYLLIALSVYLLTLQSQGWRLGGLLLVALATLWASLPAAVYTGMLGALILAFFPTRLWKEVLVFAAGGITGALNLFLFYRWRGVWNGFVSSVLPHLAGGAPDLKAHSRGGLTQTFELPYLAGAIIVILAITLIKRRPWKLPLFALVSSFCIPVTFLTTGIFPDYYGWFLHFLMVAFIFALLSKEPILSRINVLCVACLVLISVVVPGNFVRRTIKSRAHLIEDSDSDMRAAAFIKKVIKPNDVAMVSPFFYYYAKPIARRTYSGVTFTPAFITPQIRQQRQKEWGAIDVWVCPSAEGGSFPGSQFLEGDWRETEERLYAWNENFLVFRRYDQPLH